MGDIRKAWKKAWHFIWEDNSVWSWIANILLAFLIIRYIFYPVMGFALGTSHPVVAVVSTSMEHPGGFDEWWNTECCLDNPKLCLVRKPQSEIYNDFYSVNKDEFREFSYKNGFNKGDLMVLVGPKSLEKGDIIVYVTDKYPEPIIHRIVRINETTNVYSTKGDRNCRTADFEASVGEDQIIGKAVLKIPFLGWLKVLFVDLLKLVHIL